VADQKAEAKTLTRVELDAVSCSCGKLGCRGRNHGIMARCHRDAGLEVICVARIQVAWLVPS